MASDLDVKALDRQLENAEREGCAYVIMFVGTGLTLCTRLRAAEQDRDDARTQLEAMAEDARRLEEERDEARAALIRSQEDHRAAIEALETYEERIGDIADHVLGLVPPDVPSIVKLDAIERRCGEERVAARQAERERDEARAALAKLEDEHARLLAIATSARIDRTELLARAEAAEARVAELTDLLVTANEGIRLNPRS